MLLFSKISSGQNDSKYAPYGGVFTPKGDLKALIVLVKFKDHNSANPKFSNKEMKIPKWPIDKNKGFPEFVDPQTGNFPTYLFNDTSDFSTQMDNVDYNYSKDFYISSMNQFRFMGALFTDSLGKPVVIEIDPSGGRSWSNMNREVAEQMLKINPNFDFSRFDSRKNRPNFLFDNSTSTPDKIVDYTIFLYRYRKAWGQQPAPRMNAWSGSGGGFASISGGTFEDFNGYKLQEGFTMTFSSDVFIHEIGHTLHNAPHLFGVNGTIGEYFRSTSVGWGSTTSIGMFRVLNAWERWYLGFIELVADIQSKEDIIEKNTFILRDFVTTGDAIRIKIPHTTDQYLWLENHAMIHEFDQHKWKGKIINTDTIANNAAGVYAYVERIADKRTEIFGALSDKTNGLYFINASGNYDYTIIDKPEKPVKNGWGNPVYSFRRGAENPYAGTNRLFFFRADLDDNGSIQISKNYNTARQEQTQMIEEEVRPGVFRRLYGSFGVYDVQKSSGYTGPPCFRGGDLFSATTNPPLTNYPRYDSETGASEAHIITNLKLEFEPVSNTSDVLVRMIYTIPEIDKDINWAGQLDLYNLSNDEAPDLIIGKQKKLKIVASGTISRHSKNEMGTFIDPSVFTLKKNSEILLKRNARLVVTKGNTLSLEEGANIKLSPKAMLVIEPSAKLILNGNSIEQMKRSKIKNQGLIID